MLVVLVFAVAFSLVTVAPRDAQAGHHRAKLSKIRAKSVLLVSFDGRKVYFQRHATRVRSIASLTKMMATLVIVEHGLKMDGVTTITATDARVASGGCRTRLLKGMKVKNRDLLYAALLASDNRSIPAMGRAVGLSPKRLVAAMNARARKMGLKNTRFIDPVGINHGNVSTAYEVAKILRQVVLNPVLQKVMRTRTHFFHPVWPHRRAINYYNTNALLHKLRYPVYGGKTGFNSRAGYCVASAMRLPGMGPVLAVVMGSTSKTQRFADFYTLLHVMEQRGATRPHSGVARHKARRRGRARHARKSRRPHRARHARRWRTTHRARHARRSKRSKRPRRAKRSRRKRGGTGSLYADGTED